MIVEIEGDLVKQAGQFDVIAHGCNCFCTFGAGIAKAIREKFPEAYYEVDLTTKKGDRSKLGTITFTKNTTPVIINCYTQYNYGREKGRVYCSYDAIRSCMKEIKAKFHGKKIGLPKIGCNLAGGDWAIVNQIIADELGQEDVTIVILK